MVKIEKIDGIATIAVLANEEEAGEGEVKFLNLFSNEDIDQRKIRNLLMQIDFMYMGLEVGKAYKLVLKYKKTWFGNNVKSVLIKKIYTT